MSNEPKNEHPADAATRAAIHRAHEAVASIRGGAKDLVAAGALAAAAQVARPIITALEEGADTLDGFIGLAEQFLRDNRGE